MIRKFIIALVIATVVSIVGINVAFACNTCNRIDIKPYSYPNVINCNGNGNITVAILRDNGGYAYSVDVNSVEFEGASPWKHQFEDVDGDDDMNIVFHFRIRHMTDLVEGQTIGTLTWVANGTPSSGSDSIILRGCGS